MEKMEEILISTIDYFGFQLLTHDQVYTPSDDTELAVKFLQEWTPTITQTKPQTNPKTNPQTKPQLQTQPIRILEVGTGTGILSLCITRRILDLGFIPFILAIDINPISIQIASENAKINHLDQYIHFLQGTLTDPIQHSQHSQNPTYKSPFDLIISNPPYLPSEPQTIHEENQQPIDLAWDGGIQGYELTFDLLDQLSALSLIGKDTEILLISSSTVNQPPILEKFQSLHLEVRDKRSIHIFFEDIILYHIRREPPNE